MESTTESTSLLHNQFLSLLRLGIGRKSELLHESVDWDAIETMSVKHGLLAVICDAVQQFPENQRPPQVMWLRWIGQVMQSYEVRYEAYRKAIVELAAFYNAHGHRMMLLKGLACGMDWPKPNHRPYGDIDIWQFGKQKEADAVLENLNHDDNVNGHKGKVFGEIKIDRSHHHHTVFNWMGFTVENHYDFVNVHAHRSSAELEKIFKELGKDDSHFVELRSTSTGSTTKVYLPSPNLHALFLMKHMASHFAAVGITLRQVLDWAFFVEKHTNEVDWKWLDGLLVKYHMKEFFNCINAICVEDLGFDFNGLHAYGLQFTGAEVSLKERVLADILNPQFSSAEPSAFVPRMIYKYKRWQGNAWKQRLCYPDSRWSAFWCGVWSHILKPSSI